MKMRAAAAGLVATLGALTAARGGGSASGSGTTVNWWTWDDKQAAAYRRQSWPTTFTYDDPVFAKTLSWGALAGRPRVRAEDRHVHHRRPGEHQ